MDASGQTFLAADVMRRYRSLTPLSVARLAASYLTTTVGTPPPALVTPAAPAAKMPPKLPSTNNAILARAVVNVFMTSLLKVTVFDDAPIRHAGGGSRLPRRIEVVPADDGFVPKSKTRRRNSPSLALGLAA